MEYIGGFFAVNTDALEWEDGSAILGLPEGVEIKAIREGYDEVSERTERFVRFPPGYVEPRHEHDHYHCIYILEGEMHVDGKVLKAGDYIYGCGKRARALRVSRRRHRVHLRPREKDELPSPAGGLARHPIRAR